MTDFESVVPALIRLGVELKYHADGSPIEDLSDYVFVVHTEHTLTDDVTIVAGTVAWPVTIGSTLLIKFEQNRVVGLPVGAIALYIIQVLNTLETKLRAVRVR